AARTQRQAPRRPPDRHRRLCADAAAALFRSAAPGRSARADRAAAGRHAAEHFAFVPDRPANEFEFKRAYAKAALEAGLTREQIVGVYAFETGGNGTY